MSHNCNRSQALRCSAQSQAAGDSGYVSVLQSLKLARGNGSTPARDASPPQKEGRSASTMDRVKSLGVAGTLSYVAVETAFWAVALPAAFVFYRFVDDGGVLADVDGNAKILGSSLAFINIVRAFVPLRLAAAVALAPATEKVLATFAKSRVDIEALKAAITTAAGQLNGTDRSARQTAELLDSITALSAANPSAAPARDDLKGSVWRLVFTDSTGNSSGKIGPFAGVVTQEFDADGVSYANVVTLGPLVIRLDASYSATSSTTLRVQFEAISVAIGSVRVLRKPFEDPKPRGTWDMLFSEVASKKPNAWRILRIPETKNVFVLERIA